jgi:hypothetical protein
MTRTIMITLIYLLLALALEVAVLPQFLMLAPPRLAALLDLRFLALSGILIGLLRGEIHGMAVALMAACLYGFSQPPGVLGASIVSFVTVGFLAGLLARSMRPHRPVPSWIALTLLLILERLIWCLTRHFFWPDTPFDVPWLAVYLTAFIGVLIYKILLPARMKVVKNFTFE